MIDAKQIMIGNWFSHNENWNCYGHKGYFQFTESDWYAIGECTLFLEDADYIPLSEEILLKCGFEKYTWCDACFIKTKFGDLMIRFFNNEIHLFFTNIMHDSQGMKFKGKRYIGNINSTQNIKYLHHLQNFYKITIGKELDIKL